MKEKILEVIVNNTQDAIEAEAGGADRLEIVRDLEHGGLTPDIEIVRQIASVVRLPLRVMLRENTSMALKDSQELEVLCRQAAELNILGVDGLVAGFIADNQIDEATLRAIMQAAPGLKMTFHRAFDDLPDALQAIATLKTHPQVDRILTIGGPGPWSARKLRLHHWQRYAAPEITILAGAGLLKPVISDLGNDRQIREIHIGRAARIPQETGGRVCRVQVAQLKGPVGVRLLDWVVLFAWLISLVSYGLWRGRGSNTVNKYLLAGRTMPWYAMGLSILATQASAITFISTTGQGYIDGMRFVQFYLGLPIAMVLLCATAVPIFHRAKVYTAYEYLEKRFDAKTRTLVSSVFLIQRGLGAGIGLYAPAVALSAVLGVSDRSVTVLIGALVVIYVTTGGIKALTWADVQQMSMIFVALIVSLAIAVHTLPHDISLLDAVHLAGAANRINIIDTHFNLSNRYNVWSGLIGGAFLALAYFGCDQSQVQRYLTGKSIAQSRLSLIFNAVVKIPMQLFILFIGVVVFAVSLFVQPPMIFHPLESIRARRTSEWAPTKEAYDHAFSERRLAAVRLADELRNRPEPSQQLAEFRDAQLKFEATRHAALNIVAKLNHASTFDDTNYIFLAFIRTYFPVGLIGLVIGVILSASMGSTSGEINSLATVSLIDIYRRYVKRDAGDAHYLVASRFLTVFWTAFAVAFATIGARGFGALIERVNIVGSLFYGGLLGVFVLAFFFKRVQGTAAFYGVIAGEAAIFSCAIFTDISFLWYNVVGSVVVVAAGLMITAVSSAGKHNQSEL